MQTTNYNGHGVTILLSLDGIDIPIPMASILYGLPGLEGDVTDITFINNDMRCFDIPFSDFSSLYQQASKATYFLESNEVEETNDESISSEALEGATDVTPEPVAVTAQTEASSSEEGDDNQNDPSSESSDDIPPKSDLFNQQG